MRYAFAVLTALALPAPMVAQDPAAREHVQILDPRSIPRDVADDVTRVFNASETLRLSGSQVIEAGRAVASDVAVINGRLEIAGRVSGRVVGINAEVILLRGARVERDVIILGGRLDARGGGTVAGDVRVYRDQVQVEQTDARAVIREDAQDEAWYRRHERWRQRAWSDLRFLSARTYNRVEGLPLLIGPAFGRDLDWGRFTVEVLGILRSADSFEWDSQNLGHSVKSELTIGTKGGMRLGGRLFDLVEPVEPWHLSDAEVGLAAFLLHRDYRDYFDRHGGSVSASLFLGTATDVTVAFSNQRWGAREARSPFTLFRGGQSWRPNPALDEGTFHLLNATWRFDTRNDDEDPWSGWYAVADYEYGVGDISRAGPASLLARAPGVNGHLRYDRAFVDLRRYNRVSPEGQLNLRLVLGGWLSGDELPLQRRFSVGGPGTLPGYDFRRIDGSTDHWQCSGPITNGFNVLPLYPAGVPAQCERVALAQIEYRGEIHIDPLGVLNEERHRRRRGWGRVAEWVVFADAGRGWLVGPRAGELQYAKGELPPIGTFRTDVGIGIRLDDVGLYLAKSVSDPETPMNFFVRLRPRF
jgi:hypothetical protein